MIDDARRPMAAVPEGVGRSDSGSWMVLLWGRVDRCMIVHMLVVECPFRDV
jgi:hypothetical protein